MNWWQISRQSLGYSLLIIVDMFSVLIHLCGHNMQSSCELEFKEFFPFDVMLDVTHCSYRSIRP
jgi:hypothetical protein